MQLTNIQKENLHHAYIVEGGTEKVLRDFIEQTLRIQIKHNPDIFFNTYSNFGIDESRKLKERAIAKTVHAEAKQIFVLTLKGITREAQNALLKLFEEPTPDTYFFILAPTRGIFLPTVLSRVQIVNARVQEDVSDTNTKAITFLHATKKERLDILAPLIKEKDILKIDALYTEIENLLYAQFSSGDISKGELVQIVADARNQLFTPGASLKILAESLALVL